MHAPRRKFENTNYVLHLSRCPCVKRWDGREGLRKGNRRGRGREGRERMREKVRESEREGEREEDLIG